MDTHMYELFFAVGDTKMAITLLLNGLTAL